MSNKLALYGIVDGFVTQSRIISGFADDIITANIQDRLISTSSLNIVNGNVASIQRNAANVLLVSTAASGAIYSVPMQTNAYDVDTFVRAIDTTFNELADA